MSLQTSGKSPEDAEANQQAYGYKKDFRTALPQVIAVSVKNFLLLGYGMTLGFPTILIPAVQAPKDGEPLSLNNSEISWISSINLIVVPVGCALSGLVTSPLGRRRSMQLVNLPFFIAWLLLHFAGTRAHLYAALSLTGLAGGLLEAPVLTYVAEITQPYLRGSLSATSSMCIILGVFTQFLFGLIFYWRTVALINIVFTVLSVLFLFFIPESPHWLVSRKKIDEARLSLQWLRGWCEPKYVEEELKDIQELFKNRNLAGEDAKESIIDMLSHYLDKSFIVPFFLVSYSFFVGHFGGMTTLQTYAVSIFEALDAPIDKYYATLILGLLQIFGSILCVSLVHRVGKRPLAILSTLGGGLCCLLLAVYDFVLVKSHHNLAQGKAVLKNATLAEHTTFADNPYAWMPMVLLMLLAFITHTGIRFLPWILIGEVFNAKTRSGSAGLSSAMGYFIGFLANKLYISMVDSISIWGTYGFYSIISISGCVTLHYILPETEGKKLIDIENHFIGIKKLTNRVYKSQRRKSKIVSKLQEINGATKSFEDHITKL